MILASIGNGLPFVLLLLACPLMMVFMMRGMHGGHGGAGNEQGGHAGHGCGHHGSDGSHGHASEPETLDELRRRRDDLEDEIARREQETAQPVGSGR